ncbi:hypothetical protein [Eudoraea chungangensis]|uniref:hypothetical protein n=1 Tax=Eudoraea chungangensis TaxID=1481905 RepID=UPI0023EC5E40|nr:hypothetical protein [Eudoraea chungangensis]
MKSNLEQTQSILYLGYVLLVVLGIIHETLFYSQFGVNILEYSDILDVLLSPISQLTSNIILLSLSLLVIVLVIVLPKWSNRLKDKKWFVNFFKLNTEGIVVEKKVLNTLTTFSVIFFVGIFVGSGFGKGEKLKNKIRSGDVDYNDSISFIDGNSIKAEVIGKNSSYIFYLIKDRSDVTISPISGTVKSLIINK